MRSSTIHADPLDAPMLTPADVAVALSVSPATVRRLAATGDLPSIRVGRQVRFPADALQTLTSPRKEAA